MNDEREGLTIRDIARAAGVSTATVSRVINQTGKVSPKTKETVQLALHQCNYKPNASAVQLAQSRSAKASRRNKYI